MSSHHVTYDFDRPIDRRHDARSYSQKWSCSEALAKRLGVKEITDNHIALFTADMDLRCAQPILDALHATVDPWHFWLLHPRWLQRIHGCRSWLV